MRLARRCARGPESRDAIARTFYGTRVNRPHPALPADPTRYRILLVPGFLATCYPGIHSFEDVVEAARHAGFAADSSRWARATASSERRAHRSAVERIAASDGADHPRGVDSKGVADALALIVARPDLAGRTVAIVGIAGAFRGSPLADSLAFAYRTLYGIRPPAGCATSEGDPVGELTPARRAAWWDAHGAAIHVPLYALVTVPQSARLSPVLALPHALLASRSRYNDGMLLARDQVRRADAPRHRRRGPPDRGHPASGRAAVGALVLGRGFPRADVILAAIDVIASRHAR